jgi:hypothetical protein
MSTSDTQKQSDDSVKEIGEQFLLKANDYFQSELKCMFVVIFVKKKDRY